MALSQTQAFRSSECSSLNVSHFRDLSKNFQHLESVLRRALENTWAHMLRDSMGCITHNALHVRVCQV